MDFNSLDDYKKMLLNEVTVVTTSDKTFYLKLAGPLNFDIAQNMSDQGLSKEDRSVKLLCACICNNHGLPLFDPNNAEHLQIVRSFDADTVTVLLNQIWAFFDKKKE